MNYLAQSQDVTSGRFPDGQGGYQRLTRPTPRGANAPPVAVLAPQLTTSVDAATGFFQLTWTSQPGAVYRVEFKRELDDPAWRQVGATHIGGGAAQTISILPEASATGFYRIVTE